MNNPNTLHVDQDQLVQLLWLAAPIPGVSNGLLHLVEECNGCFKPHTMEKATPGLHLGKDDLDDFAGRLFAQASKEVIDAFEHLVHQCPVCLDVATPILEDLRRRSEVEWSPTVLDEITERASSHFAAWSKKAPQEKLDAPKLGRQLLSHPLARRRLLIRNSERYRTWPAVDWLCEESKKTTHKAPKEAISIAETAVITAESLDPEHYGEAITADIIARAWAYLGNAYRTDEAWNEACLAFDTAEGWEGRGTQFGNTRAEIMYLRSYVASALHRFEEAHKLLGAAQEIYRELGDPHMQGRLSVIQANVYLKEAKPEESVNCLTLASQQIDVDREPRLLFVAKQNLLLALADLELYSEADDLLPEVFELTKSAGNRLDLLRLRWTEARIDTGLGRSARAEMTLSELKESFKGLCLPYDAALVGLELANLYSNQGRTREIKLLALELVPVFAKNELHREALAAVTLFARAAAAEEATVEVVQKTLDALKNAAKRS